MTLLPSYTFNRVRADVQAMHAYQVQDAKQGQVKLDAMENPHRLPPELQARLGQRLGALALNRYPNGRVKDLRHALAEYASLPEGFDLILGNGSDELISLLALTFAVPPSVANHFKKPSVLAPEPGFVMVAMSSQLQGLDFVGVPLTCNFELDLPAMLDAIALHQPAITYLAYPNNPTANLWNDAAIESVITACAEQGGFVVIDEAYQPFSAKSYIDRLAQHSHVLLLRTLSKFGLAGVRLGYLMGHKDLIAQIDKVRPPYNVSVLNCEAALFALENKAVFEAQALDIRSQRAHIFDVLSQLPHVHPYPSQANMILVRVPDAQKTFDDLAKRGILVKNVSKMHPLLANCLRLTVGTATENSQMLDALITTL